MIAAIKAVLCCVSIATALSNYTQRFVNYDDDKRISYYTAGNSSGSAIILLHGWPGIAKTWHYQIDYLVEQGWYVIAPDMPGYGDSTARNISSDYSHQSIISGLLKVLDDIGRTQAIWIGHDWGAGVASSLVATNPEVVTAVAWLDVPYRTVERGLVDLLPYVNRTIYPIDTRTYGQWDYMVYYEENFERVTAVFDSNVGYALRAILSPWDGNSSSLGQPSELSTIRANDGWFGGIDQLPSAETIPLDVTVMTKDLYDEFSEKMSKTGFAPGNHYYTNHAANRAFNLAYTKNNGTIGVPCLFIEAKYDAIVDVAVSELLLPMTRFCPSLTVVSVNTSHWLQLEKPDEVNQAFGQWLQDIDV